MLSDDEAFGLFMAITWVFEPKTQILMSIGPFSIFNIDKISYLDISAFYRLWKA